MEMQLLAPWRASKHVRQEVRMMNYDRESLSIDLQRRFGSTTANANTIAYKMLSIDSTLADGLKQYWENGTIPDVEVRGWSVHRLMTERGMKPLEALLTLDEIIREPDLILRSLARGYDSFRRKPKELQVE